MERTIERFGENLNLAFTLDANEPTDILTCTVYRLYNKGVLSSLPDDFSESDRHVIVTTTPERLRKAFVSMAETTLQGNAEFCRSIKGFPGFVFLNAAQELAPKLAGEFLRSFERVQTRSNRAEVMSPYGQGTINSYGESVSE